MRTVITLLLILSITIIAQQQNNGKISSQNQSFIENKGQWPPEVRYLAKIGGMNAWITGNGVVYDYYTFEKNYEESDLTDMRRQERKIYEREHTSIRGQVVKVKYQNAILNAGDEAVGEQNWAYHYYIGSDQSKWAEYVKLYDEVRTTGLYEGIDIRYYFDGGLLRYDYKAAANADISQIAMEIEGADNIEVNANGELVVKTVLGDVVHGKLFAYQDEWYGLRPVECGFIKKDDGSIGIDAAEYNRNKPLTIDPIVYSTFIGGTGYDEGYAVTATLGRRPVITGTTSSSNFPTSAGAYDVTYNGGYDIFVTRLYSGGEA